MGLFPLGDSSLECSLVVVLLIVSFFSLSFFLSLFVGVVFRAGVLKIGYFMLLFFFIKNKKRKKGEEFVLRDWISVFFWM